MKNLLHPFFGPFYGGRVGLGLLVLRLVVGYAFVLHGWDKIRNPFGWMDRPGAPSPVPDIFQGLAALAEFGGGLGLIFGFFSNLSALGIFITMVVAYFMVWAPKGAPFVGKPGGESWEILGVFMAASLGLLLAGPGKLSLDALLFGRKDNIYSTQEPSS